MRGISLFLLVSLAIVAVVSAESDPTELDDKVYGGRKANLSAFPFQVSLQGGKNGIVEYKFCGGVIIDRNWVLTAAHCFDDYKGEPTYVRAGIIYVYDEGPNAQLIEVENRFLHKSYRQEDQRVNDDIALLKLKKPFKFNAYVQAIGLPPKGYEPTGEGTILGWGHTTSRQTNTDDLLYATTSIYPATQCYEFYSVTVSQMCLGERKSKTSSCAGDSGGPFVQTVNGKLVTTGIVSYGQCGGTPVVNTKVSKYIDFINKVMNDNK